MSKKYGTLFGNLLGIIGTILLSIYVNMLFLFLLFIYVYEFIETFIKIVKRNEGEIK